MSSNEAVVNGKGRSRGGERSTVGRLRCPSAALALAAFGTLSLVILCLASTPVVAATLTDRPLLFSFDPSDPASGVSGTPDDVAIDQSSGDVYVYDIHTAAVHRFHANGTAAPFSATGTVSLPETFSFPGAEDESNAIAVDNSGGLGQGRIYVTQRFNQKVSAFDSSGTLLWELTAPFVPCGAATDVEGHLWIGNTSDPPSIQEYAATGSPPGLLGSFPVTSPASLQQGCQITADTSGGIYLDRTGEGEVQKYVGGSLASSPDVGPSFDVDVDQSSATGHLFTVHESSIMEFDSTGALLGDFGTAGATIGAGRGIAYDHSLDRVYVADHSSSTVQAFGPVATGTAPDVTIEAPSGIGISRALFSGMINPQGVANSYHFEWKLSGEPSWGRAKSSPAQSVPADTSEHNVSFETHALSGGQTYDVRLVGTNAENGLSGFSDADTFTTATAVAPVVTIEPVSAVGTTTALLHGTVNPNEDAGTVYRFQTSLDPLCASEFSNRPLKNLESEANIPVPVSEELTALLPSQHICVRLSATNSGGTVTSTVEQFTTDAIPPSQVFTAFAAPRTDTGARLNGYVNPEGAVLTYHFEYTEDGGSTWTPLADREDTSESRDQIVVGEELGGLNPNTTYGYRFVAETNGGSATPQGEMKTFVTRTSEEMSPPSRGDELVNTPDKGNQNVRAEPSLGKGGQSAVSADGEKAIWTVNAGAPGGTTGNSGSFLATRSAGGWHSKALTPVADVQVGGGSYIYKILGASNDDSRFFFAASEARAAGAGPPTLVRVDVDGEQDILRAYQSASVEFEGFQMTDDAEHMLLVDSPTRQIEDIGGATPEAVSVMPDGALNACGLADTGQSFGGIILGGDFTGAGLLWRPGYRQVSATDARRVYFEAIPNGRPCGDGEHGLALYMRDRSTHETTLVDDGTSSHEPNLIRVTPDGTSAYFATASQLDPNDLNSDTDIYRWSEESGEASCLTCVVPDAKVMVGQTERVLVSDDFSHVYFESTSQLVPGLGKEGDRNVYALSGGSIRFVADPNSPRGALAPSNAQLSSDGNVLTFETGGENAHFQLTADHLDEGSCVNEFGIPGPCIELFRYDGSDGSLECVSCNHDGLTTHTVGTPASTAEAAFKRSADGGTVAFVTAEKLLPDDINGSFDLYEWNDGVLRLITDGETTFPPEGAPNPVAVDRNGANVFFTVDDPGLTGFEQDGLTNFYDARVGGGFERPVPLPHCSEESCQGPLEPAPDQRQAASATFYGKGNLRSKPARRRHPCARKRGRARRHCRKKHQKHAHRAKAQRNGRPGPDRLGRGRRE